MSKFSRFLTLLLVLAVATGGLAGALVTRRAVAAQWQDKVDPWVLETATEQGETDFLVFLVDQADLSATESMHTKLEKGTYVYETLTTLAENTQKPILNQLDALGVEYQSFWVANMIRVRGDMSVVQAMAQRPDVANIYGNPTVHLDDLPEENQQTFLNPEAIEWNILMVNADDVWNAGVTGEGAVIGGHDTGYDWDHPALINQYRGWNGATADHNYNWHDAIHSGGGSCGANSPEPCDDFGHGTHTMGTMVGDDGASNQIGMAPGAKWIGCRNMDVGNGTPATYSECYQWFIAPTDLNGNNPDPSKAPHVINNSWGCPASEGCSPNSLLTIVQNVVAAGILTAHSAGNDGPGCSTVNTPSAIYDESFSVGSTTNTNTISSFSSRGPVTVDASNRMKPDISAPGSGVRSSVPGGGYSTSSGTSMAAPHVAGLTGLLISANPDLAGNVALLEDIMEQTAVLVTVSPVQTCGGVPSTDIPNNTFGWGRIDAFAAYQEAISFAETLEVGKTASSEFIAPGELLTYTLNVTHTTGVTITHNVVLTDVIPANTTFVTATLPHTINGSTLSWDAPDLDVDDTFSVQLVVQVNGKATGTISNADYAVTGDESGTAFGAPVDTPVIAYGLEVGKTASSAYVFSGDILTYTITVTNQHPLAAATGLVLTDVVPANTTFVTATLPHTLNGNTVQWDAASLTGAGTWTVELVVQVNENASGTVENTDYAVYSDQVSLVNGAIVSTDVVVPGIVFVPNHAAESLAGKTVTYTHMLTNTSNITDTFDLTYTSSAGWTATVIPEVTLGPGEFVPVIVVLTVPEDALPNTVDVLTVTATSRMNPDITDFVTDTTTVISITQPPTFEIYLPIVVRSE
jgi:serine protease AprX